MVTVSNARRWGIVSLLFAASLVNYLDRATLAVALPAIALDLALGPALKGILLSPSSNLKMLLWVNHLAA
jgi:hypothetical protein